MDDLILVLFLVALALLAWAVRLGLRHWRTQPERSETSSPGDQIPQKGGVASPATSETAFPTLETAPHRSPLPPVPIPRRARPDDRGAIAPPPPPPPPVPAPAPAPRAPSTLAEGGEPTKAGARPDLEATLRDVIAREERRRAEQDQHRRAEVERRRTARDVDADALRPQPGSEPVERQPEAYRDGRYGEQERLRLALERREMERREEIRRLEMEIKRLNDAESEAATVGLARPTPAIREHAASAAAPGPVDKEAAEPFRELTVFYGTNRSKADAVTWYGTERDSMRYGRCLVTVPTDRRIGSIPRPSIWTFFREQPETHYILKGVDESSKQEFSAGLRSYIRSCPGRQALVFVHGFNVTFVDAVYRTAQIAADLDFQGAPVLFSWPSKGTLHPLGYTQDENQARWAMSDLRAFLELIVEQSGADAIHVLAHSMGNRVLTDALGQISAAARRGPALFNELVLTAPDIDADTFVRDVASAIVPTAKRVTLYASSNDKALAFSKTVHGYARAGDSGDDIVLLDGIDTIDVSSVDTNFIGHFYYGDNRSVLSDLFNLMQGHPAASRFGLRPRKKKARSYWAFQP